MTEEVQNEAGLLAAYNNLKDDVRRLSAERDELDKEKKALEAAVQDNEWRNRALVAEIKTVLTNKGLKDAERLIKVLGTDGIDFDADGKVTGLDERLTEASKDYPELFDVKRRTGGKADLFTQGDAPAVDPLKSQVEAALDR